MKMTRGIAVSLMVWLCSPGVAADLRRIRSDINDGKTFRLPGNTRPAVAGGLAVDRGAVAGGQPMPRMSLHFVMTDGQRADLNQLLTAQQNRRSPQYRKFLTPEQYAERFGLHPTDMAKVTGWLENNGFVNVRSARGGTSVSFSGTAAQAQAVFHTQIRRYSLNGETHFSNASDPQLPRALSGLVQSVGGLNNFRMKPHSTPIRPHFNGGNSYNSDLAPDDWQTIYNVKPLYGAGIDGTGVTIAIVGQSNIQLTDIQAFRAASGLAAKNPTIVVPPSSTAPGTATSDNGDEVEADIDLEWSGGIAKNADILFVTASATTGNGIVDALTYVVDNNAAPIVSISYGVCEKDISSAHESTLTSLYQQASAEGITIVAASGDSGAAACDAAGTIGGAAHGLAVDIFASSPYVTGIGGTVLSGAGGSYFSTTNNANNGSALSYIPETVWGGGGGPTEGSGGGASIVFAKPNWQVGPGVPNDGQRDVPDLAFAASPNFIPYLICSGGWCTNGFQNAAGYVQQIGGTSVSAPAFAGVLALLVQQTGGRLGNINPNLYSLASISANAFHDITSGDNTVFCKDGTPDCPPVDSSGLAPTFGYVATAGYDQTTGWGSIDASNFVEQWSGDIEITASPAALTIEAGHSKSANITVAPQNHFSGVVSFSCSVSSSLFDVTCSVPTKTVNTSGSTTVTITAASTARVPLLPRFPPLPKIHYEWFALGSALGLGAWISRRRSMYFVGVGVVAAAELVLISCGSGSSSGGGSGPSYQPLTLTCSLPTAKEGTPYSAGCSATGGNSVYTYSLIDGLLPYGLSMTTTTGAITGTPLTPGLTSFTIQVADSAFPAHFATQEIKNFAVNAATPLTLSCTFPNGQAGLGYYGQCNPNGGTPPINYSVSAGALPAGLILDTKSNRPALVIGGKPTLVGTSSFTVNATDSGTPAVNAAADGSILVQPTPEMDLFCNLLNAQAHVAYGWYCSALGGAPPVTFSVVAGTPPPGMTLDSDGRFSGLPSAAGTSHFTVSVTDSGYPPQTKTEAVTLVVDPPPTETGIVTITATSGGIVNTTTIAVTVPGIDTLP